MRNSNISSPSLEKVVVGAVCLGRDWLGLTIQSIYMSPGYIRHFNRERGKGHTKLQLVFFLSLFTWILLEPKLRNLRLSSEARAAIGMDSRKLFDSSSSTRLETPEHNIKVDLYTYQDL